MRRFTTAATAAAAAAASSDPNAPAAAAAAVVIPLLFSERFSMLRALAVALSCLVGSGTEPNPILRTPAGRKVFEAGVKMLRRWPVVGRCR